MMAGLRVYLLGTPRIEYEGEILKLSHRKAMALLAYLLLNPGPHSREFLATLLWPDSEPKRAYAYLRNALWRLNRTPITDWLISDRETIELQIDDEIWLDTAHVTNLLNECRKHGHAETGVCALCEPLLSDIADLYKGNFMEGFTLEDSTAYDDWQFEQAERIRERLAGVLERLVQWYGQQGAYSQAIPYARRWLTLDDLHEPAHRHLMRLYAWDGQHSAAVRQYEACVRSLDEALGVSPTAETTELYEDIRSRKLELPGQAKPALETTEKSTLLVVPTVKQASVTTPEEPQPLAGERRVVTALFAEIKGYPTQSAGDDLETWAEMMHDVLQILKAEIERFGGEVSQYRDDGLLALFGQTRIHEDDPERAVLAGLAMQKVVRSYTAETTHNLELRAGVNTGEVITTVVGDQQGSGTTLGRVVGLAERMGEAADPGTVLVAEATYRLIEALFEWQIVGRFQVQGMRAPVGVFRPLTRKDLLTKGRGIEGLQSALVGRDGEFQALQEAVERLRIGIGGIITLVGEAGIGKSRLVAELKSDALNSAGEIKVNWQEGRCLSYATNVAYQLWINMLRTWLDAAPDAAPEEVGNRLQASVREVCPDVYGEVYPFLARMLSLPLDEVAVERLRGIDAGGVQVLTFRAMETLIDQAAQTHPLVLVCEDLHWSDPTSQALLEYLLPLTDRVPLLLVCVMRPETTHNCWQIRELAARDYHHRHADLWLEPLSSAESGTLIGNLLNIEDLPSDLRDRILKRAAGNPFFLEEILRSLMEDEVIAYEEITDPSTGLSSSHWVATREIEDLSIPETLHGVLTTRIDRLAFQAKRMLQLASVIGRTFSYRVLEDISGNGKVHDLESQIIVLQRAQLIRERARLPEREYIFKHVLTQEAAYNGLLKRERRAIHQRVADVLERLYPEHIEERLGLLAHHWEQAGDIDKTVEYLRRAGEQAAAQYANAEAVDYLSRALEMVPDTDMSIRYDLLLSREEIYFLQGRKELQAQDWPDLTALAEALDADDPLPGRSRSAEVGLRRIRIAIRTGKYNEAEEQALENLRLAQESTDKYAEAAAMREWGRVLFYRQNYTDSIQKLEQALSLARQADLREIEVDSSDTLGRAYMESGQVDKSLDLLSHELRVCQENGFRRREGIVFRDLAYAFSAQGDYTKALIYAEKSLQICREVGHRSDEGWALRAIGMIAIYQRPIDYVMIEHYMTQAIEIFSEMQDIHGLDWIYSVLHDIAEGQDDDTQVLCYAEEITDIFRQANYLRGVAVKFFKIGYFLLVRGQYTEAQSYLEQACRISEDIKSQEIQGWARIYTGRLYLALGDYNKAQMFSKESLAAARENDYSFLEYRCLGILSLIALAQGHYESANMYGQKTLTIAENIRNRFWQGQAKLILGHTLSGLGDWDAAEESYNQSIQLTKQIHFKFESAKTEAILDAKAGLTTMQLMRSDLSPPLSLAEEFLEHIKNQPRLPYTWQPMWIYLTCVQVLEANGDTRAQEVLEQAYNLIQERAATIEDEDLHRSYLENVPENREIVRLWERKHKDIETS